MLRLFVKENRYEKNEEILTFSEVLLIRYNHFIESIFSAIIN